VRRQVTLIVERGDEGGDARPGWALRAGDRVVRTEYDHGRAVLRVVTADEPMGLVEHLRRWWEGRRR
jgi:hypothetical protein